MNQSIVKFRSITLVIWMAFFALQTPQLSHAWQVSTGFTDPCHEGFATEVYADFLSNIPPAGLPVPDGEVWDKLSRDLVQEEDLPAPTPQHRFALFSLIVGVRYPDTDGHSILNLSTTRSAHIEQDNQYAHCLRRADDDGETGDIAAVLGTKDYIRYLIELANASRMKPIEDQVVATKMYLDFYGRFDVMVWEPLFYLGQAMHAVHDSFSHTIRTQDLRQIVHVMNYVEAVTGDHDQRRDGMAHSNAMDACSGEMMPLANAAIEASIDFVVAVRDELGGLDSGATDRVLDKWMTYQPGCNIDNDYCNSAWVEIAKTDQTQPMIEEYLGCQCGIPNSLNSKAYFFLLVLFLVLISFIRRNYM